MICSHCNHDNPPEARFCGNCGSPLAVAEPPAPPSAEAVGAESGAEPSGAPTTEARVGPVAAAPAFAVEVAYERYVGFWRRAVASLVDSFIMFAGLSVLTIASLTADYFMLGVVSIAAALAQRLLPWAYWVLFTGLRGQTPGKMLLGIRVVNREGRIPGLGRAVRREIIGKLVSTLVFSLGFLWVAWDARKQGWHDRIAGTYVVYDADYRARQAG